MIFGRPGSGKSTFALKLHELTGLPLYHLDKYFFTSHWVERVPEEFLDIQCSLVAQDSWIIDGNSTKTLEIRYARADLVLYFNYPKWICLYRILKRRFIKDKRIDDRADKFPEIIRPNFITYMWQFEKRVANQLKYLKDKYPTTHFCEIKLGEDLNKLEKRLAGYF